MLKWIGWIILIIFIIITLNMPIIFSGIGILGILVGAILIFLGSRMSENSRLKKIRKLRYKAEKLRLKGMEEKARKIEIKIKKYE
ncbi:hypothetical protein [Marinitoga sp. 1138]|uniref:hypothetical protein n=1 Tax=Marinitoga sp. 1138 TaxID=1643334 RepID=UPI001585E8BA|nr:hypothetical protein [Marinitoga sp. 1138]NUU96722.1 hypothetical protein [Marinitoga sp. 1138]